MDKIILLYSYYPIDQWYLLLIVPSIVISLVAQVLVKKNFSRYSQVNSHRGITGAQAARQILDEGGVRDVEVTRVEGALTDHYSPTEHILRLSDPVFASSSIAALGVAGHEAGHALQHAQAYFPLTLRNMIYPVARLGSGTGPYLILLSFLFNIPFMFTLGMIFYAASVLFFVFTLPVEFDASRRSLALLEAGGYLNAEELVGARKVLRAAALTYVASTLTAFASLLRLLMINNSRNRQR